MGRQGIPMTRKERLWLIELFEKNDSLREIEEKTGFSNTVIKQTRLDYENGLIDAKGYKKNVSVGEADGEFKIIANPIEFVKKE